MAPLRFGLIGTGYWALHTHGTALSTSPHASLNGIWGRDAAKAKDLASRLGAKGYEDIDEMLASVDAVAMAVPPDVQAQLAVRAANAGCHLLLEKPVALDVASAQAVASAVQRSGVAALVFFTSRFRPDAERWLEASAAMGPWHSAHLVHYGNIFQPGSPYANSAWRREYGALWDVGPHALAAIMPVMGRVTSVAARSGPLGSDTVHIVLTHSNEEQAVDGPTGASTVSLSLTMPSAAAANSLALYGDRGTRVRPETSFEAVEAFQAALAALSSMVETGQRQHPCDAVFGLNVVQVLAAAEQAIGLPAVELDSGEGLCRR